MTIRVNQNVHQGTDQLKLNLIVHFDAFQRDILKNLKSRVSSITSMQTVKLFWKWEKRNTALLGGRAERIEVYRFATGSPDSGRKYIKV